MTLLNLTLGQFLAVFLPLAAGIVTLYLYDRSRRRQIVSTLRFFRPAARAPIRVRRRKIQQPWSLVLQIVCLLLLLLAIAEPQLGRREESARDHVLIVESSAWMNSAAAGRPSLMQAARRAALDYLRAVPAHDRVLLVRADALATPLTSFTGNRRELEQAIRALQPSATALNLSGALDLARSAQRLASSRPGEVVLITSGRAAADDAERAAAANVPNLRAILLAAEPNDCGLRKLAARRTPADPLLWEIDAAVYNYGTAERRVALSLSFAGRPIGSRALRLAPGAAAEAQFRHRSAEPGRLEAVIDSKDDYRADNRSTVELPALRPLAVEVFTDRPALWQPLLTATPFLAPQFRQPAEYAASGASGRLVILDGFAPAAAPDADAAWIAPPAALALSRTHVRRWNEAHPLTAGLRNKDLRLDRAAALEPAAGEVVVAESDRGPVLVASAGPRKTVRFGFHPLDSGLGQQLAAPLLFANLVRWVSPDLFRLEEIRAGSPGLIEVEVAEGTPRDRVQVRSPSAGPLPFTLTGNRLRFFAGRSGAVRVALPDRELVYSLNLPEVAEGRWTPPEGARKGLPPPLAAVGLPADLWPWLALAGALGLLVEWMWFGRRPEAAPAATAPPIETLNLTSPPPAPEPQEVRS